MHIAETARAARASVVVTNHQRHFAAPLRHGLRALDASEFAAEVGLEQPVALPFVAKSR